MSETCVCGHLRTTHTHNRHGSDCGICGWGCLTYRRKWPWRAWNTAGGPMRRQVNR